MSENGEEVSSSVSQVPGSATSGAQAVRASGEDDDGGAIAGPPVDSYVNLARQYRESFHISFFLFS